mgnify:FL=1
MPTARSRLINETHPVARYLFLAEQLSPTDTLVLEYANKTEAKKAAAALARFRASGKLGPPGSFEPTSVDPKGEGVGYFDKVGIGISPYFGGLLGYVVRLYRIPEGQTSRRGRFPKPVVERVETNKYAYEQYRIETSGTFDPPIPDLPDGALT